MNYVYQRGGSFGMFPMCIDTLALVSKHAEGMSLRYDANLTHTRVGINLLS